MFAMMFCQKEKEESMESGSVMFFSSFSYYYYPFGKREMEGLFNMLSY